MQAGGVCLLLSRVANVNAKLRKFRTCFFYQRREPWKLNQMAIEGEFIETGPQKQDPSGVKSRKFGNKFKVSSIAQQKRNFLEEWSWKLIAEAQPPTIPILFTKDARSD